MANKYLETDENDFYNQLYKEFNKTKEDLEEYIDIMRKWSDTQPHFPEKPTYRTLRFVIIYNKFSIEKAKQKLDMYYTIRDILPEFFRKHPCTPEMILQSKISYCVPLPKVVKDFKRIFFVQINPKYAPEEVVHLLASGHFINIMELFVEADNCYNFHIVFDLNGLQFAHLPRLNVALLKKLETIHLNVFSNRISSIYLVNFPSFLEGFFNTVIKPLLTQKIRERLSVHTNTDILLEVFGKSCLPKDVGGDEMSLEEINELLIKKFEKHKDRFDQLQTLKVNESLRPTELVNDDILGFYGSFKKINID